MNILHIDSSARLEDSNSRQITAYIVERLEAKRANENSQLGATVKRDVAQQLLPQISAADLVDLHASNSTDRTSLVAHTKLSDELITELKSSDILVLGAPLYNFGVPVVLKQWIDYVARAGQTFRYTEQGPIGLSGVKQAFVVVTSGGTPIGAAMDHTSSYLKTVLGFLGVEQVVVIDASGSKGESDKIIVDAKAQVDDMVTVPTRRAALSCESLSE